MYVEVGAMDTGGFDGVSVGAIVGSNDRPGSQPDIIKVDASDHSMAG